MDTKIIKPEDNVGGTIQAELTDNETTSMELLPVPQNAPGFITLEAGTENEEAVYFRTRNPEAGTVGGLIRDFTGLNGGVGRPHQNGSAWEIMQSAKSVANLVDVISEGYFQEQMIIARVDAVTFTVATNRAIFYTTGRYVRFNKDNDFVGLVSSSSYDSGPGLTTVTVQDVAIPDELTTVEIGIQPKNIPAAVTPDGTFTLNNKTLIDAIMIDQISSEGVFTRPRTIGKYETPVNNDDEATITLDLATGNIQRFTLGGSRTLAITNPKTGQAFVVRALQDGSGNRTITWFAGISWPEGSAPDQPKVANTADVYGFICTNDDAGNGYANPTFDGFVIGNEVKVP